MRKWILPTIILIVLVLLGTGLYFITRTKSSGGKQEDQNVPTTSPKTAVRELTFNDKVVLASYYGWYYKSRSWAETTNAEHPLAGSYDPSDDNLISYQLSLAKDVGLDGFIYSWNGTGNPSNEAMLKMVEKMESTDEFSDFKIAPLYENVNFQWKAPNKTFIDELVYIIKTAKEHRSFIKMNGQPLVFIYNPQTISLDRWQAVLSEVKLAAGDAYYIAMPDNWDVSDDYFKYFQTITTYADKYISLDDISTKYEHLKGLNKPLIATLIGGTSRMEKNGFDIDRSDGKYLDERYRIATKNSANWLYITSWNEWFEYAQIEPSRESKFETAKYVRELIEKFKGKKFANALSNWTVSVSSQTQVKNDGPGKIYYVRCGVQDRSLLLSYILRPGEVQTYKQVCPEVSGWLLTNKKLEYKK